MEGAVRKKIEHELGIRITIEAINRNQRLSSSVKGGNNMAKKLQYHQEAISLVPLISSVEAINKYLGLAGNCKYSIVF